MGTRRLTLLRHGQAQPLDSCPRISSAHSRGAAPSRRRRSRHASSARLGSGSDPGEPRRARLVHRGDHGRCLRNRCGAGAMRARTVPGDARDASGGCWRGATAALEHILICGHNPGLSQVASRLGPAAASAATCRPADWPRRSGWQRAGTRCSRKRPRSASWKIPKTPRSRSRTGLQAWSRCKRIRRRRRACRAAPRAAAARAARALLLAQVRAARSARRGFEIVRLRFHRRPAAPGAGPEPRTPRRCPPATG